ncbi:MAG: flagellar basal body-associated FliL family protein [Pseudomonadota bacterium]
MKMLLPVFLILLGVAGGAALGVYLKPPSEAEDDMDSAEAGAEEQIDDAAVVPDLEDGPRSYVEVGKQMIVPIVDGGETRALMLFEVAVDVPESLAAEVVEAEPRLRDAFLRELMEMSYTGAFKGTYTDDRVLQELRTKLRRAARRFFGDDIADVLVLDMMRQEF